jgi:hypothetical protein
MWKLGSNPWAMSVLNAPQAPYADVAGYMWRPRVPSPAGVAEALTAVPDGTFTALLVQAKLVNRFGKSDAVEEAFKMGMWPDAGGGGSAGDAPTCGRTERLADRTREEHLAMAATDAPTNGALWVETMHARMGGLASEVDLRYLLVVAGPNAPSGHCVAAFPRPDAPQGPQGGGGSRRGTTVPRTQLLHFETSAAGKLADPRREVAQPLSGKSPTDIELHTRRRHRPPFYPLFVAQLKAPNVFGAATHADAAHEDQVLREGSATGAGFDAKTDDDHDAA